MQQFQMNTLCNRHNFEELHGCLDFKCSKQPMYCLKCDSHAKHQHKDNQHSFDDFINKISEMYKTLHINKEAKMKECLQQKHFQSYFQNKSMDYLKQDINKYMRAQVQEVEREFEIAQREIQIYLNTLKTHTINALNEYSQIAELEVFNLQKDLEVYEDDHTKYFQFPSIYKNNLFRLDSFELMNQIKQNKEYIKSNNEGKVYKSLLKSIKEKGKKVTALLSQKPKYNVDYMNELKQSLKKEIQSQSTKFINCFLTMDHQKKSFCLPNLQGLESIPSRASSINVSNISYKSGSTDKNSDQPALTIQRKLQLVETSLKEMRFPCDFSVEIKNIKWLQYEQNLILQDQEHRLYLLHGQEMKQLAGGEESAIQILRVNHLQQPLRVLVYDGQKPFQHILMNGNFLKLQSDLQVQGVYKIKVMFYDLVVMCVDAHPDNMEVVTEQNCRFMLIRKPNIKKICLLGRKVVTYDSDDIIEFYQENNGHYVKSEEKVQANNPNQLRLLRMAAYELDPSQILLCYENQIVVQSLEHNQQVDYQLEEEYSQVKVLLKKDQLKLCFFRQNGREARYRNFVFKQTGEGEDKGEAILQHSLLPEQERQVRFKDMHNRFSLLHWSQSPDELVLQHVVNK